MPSGPSLAKLRHLQTVLLLLLLFHFGTMLLLQMFLGLMHIKQQGGVSVWLQEELAIHTDSKVFTP